MTFNSIQLLKMSRKEEVKEEKNIIYLNNTIIPTRYTPLHNAEQTKRHIHSPMHRIAFILWLHISEPVMGLNNQNKWNIQILKPKFNLVASLDSYRPLPYMVICISLKMHNAKMHGPICISSLSFLCVSSPFHSHTEWIRDTYIHTLRSEFMPFFSIFTIISILTTFRTICHP